MRGRKPRRFLLAAHDKPILKQIACSRTLPWFQVKRARVVLAIAEGARVQTVAFQLQCDPSTVWRLCRRYEEAGLEGVLAEVPHAGHPIEISPLQRAQIVQLACLEPIAKGLYITHWSKSGLGPRSGG